MYEVCKYIAVILVFLAGLYFYIYPTITEGMVSGLSCPNMLVQNGDKLFLYNTERKRVPGVNPLEFDSLEDYIEFMNWQKEHNIVCPVLYLQKTSNLHGDDVYVSRPSLLDPQIGLPHSALPQTQSLLALALDTSKSSEMIDHDKAITIPENQQLNTAYPQTYTTNAMTVDYIAENATKTELDMANPMSNNWKGDEYTRSLLGRGVYDVDVVAEHKV